MRKRHANSGIQAPVAGPDPFPRAKTPRFRGNRAFRKKTTPRESPESDYLEGSNTAVRDTRFMWYYRRFVVQYTGDKTFKDR